ncbi:MAG: helix-turn-helix domain-containing protein [Deltaproteobacteria bacterium]|nr:helix-turn-helix domain-containing protein [Deltaproteobacteria bacterium]
MRLGDWIESKKLTQQEAADLFGVESQGFISEIVSGKKIVSDELAAKIEEVTKGKVTFLELKHPKYRQASNE